MLWVIIGCEQKSLGGYPRLHSSIYHSPHNKHTIKCNHIITNYLQNNNIKSSPSWCCELEEIPTRSFLGDSENGCEQHFAQYSWRLEGGVGFV